MEKGYLVIVDTAAQLVECRQNLEDVVFAGGMVIHFGKLLDDRIIALVHERRCEYGFVVFIVAFMFAAGIELHQYLEESWNPCCVIRCANG